MRSRVGYARVTPRLCIRWGAGGRLRTAVRPMDAGYLVSQKGHPGKAGNVAPARSGGPVPIPLTRQLLPDGLNLSPGWLEPGTSPDHGHTSRAGTLRSCSTSVQGTWSVAGRGPSEHAGRPQRISPGGVGCSGVGC